MRRMRVGSGESLSVNSQKVAPERSRPKVRGVLVKSLGSTDMCM
jgi:hypothetical protein